MSDDELVRINPDDPDEQKTPTQEPPERQLPPDPNDTVGKTGRFMVFAAWGFFFGVMFLFFYFYNHAAPPAPVIHPGELIITADQQGHYQIEGELNHQPVNFLLDTGATLVAIPQAVAKKAGLVGMYPITMQTANGNVAGELTRIKHLSFGAFELHNLKAVIIPEGHDDTVLLGMNVLSQFTLSQTGKELTVRVVSP